MRAIISDIHANQEALEAVLADIARQGIKDIICLGDLVGYGPNPAECIDMLEEIPTVRGNHDQAMDDIEQYLSHTLLARKTEISHAKKIGSRALRLARLPQKIEEDGTTYTHSGMIMPERYIYIDNNDYQMIRKHGQALKGRCFSGHTHIPMIVNYDNGIQAEIVEADKSYKLGQKAHVCVGSVGQPRDGDNRACYVIYNNDEVVFRRIQYDIEKTANKIMQDKDMLRPFRWLLKRRLLRGR